MQAKMKLGVKSVSLGTVSIVAIPFINWCRKGNKIAAELCKFFITFVGNLQL